MININKLPAGWQIKSIGSFSKVTTGATPLRSENERYFTGGNIPWIKTTDLNNSEIFDCEEKITEAAVKENSCSILPEHTVLIAMYGGFKQIGRTGILRIPAATNQALSAVRVNEEVLPYFLLHYLNANVSQWKRLAASSRKDPNITRQDVLDYEVVIPPLAQQEKIIAIADTWDDAIALQSRQLRQLRRRKDGIAQELLSQRKRLPSFTSAPHLASAGSIFSPVSIRGQEQEELLSVTQEQGVVPRSMLEGRVVMPEGTTAGYKLVEPGNFVISLRSFQGGIEYSEYRGLVSPAYTVLHSTNRAVPEYYKHYFKSADFISRLASAVIGIRDGKQISFKDFAIINIPNPESDEQRAIADVLDTAEAEIRLQERKLEALRVQKRGLILQLLTGQILLS